MTDRDEEDAFAPQATELLEEAGAFEPVETERLPSPAGPRAHGAEDDDEATDAPGPEDIGVSDAATRRVPMKPPGSFPHRDDAATALIPGHALGVDPVSLDELSSSKFLAPSSAAQADPFAIDAPAASAEQEGTRAGSATELPATAAWTGLAETPTNKASAAATSSEAASGSPAGSPPAGSAGGAVEEGRRRRALWAVVGLGAVGLVAVLVGVGAWAAGDDAPTAAAAPEGEKTKRVEPPAAVPAEGPTGEDKIDPEPEQSQASASSADPGSSRRARRGSKVRKRDKSRRARRKRSSPATSAAASTKAPKRSTRVAKAGPSIAMRLGKMRDASGAGIPKLKPMLTTILKKRLQASPSVKLTSVRPQQGFVVDAWIQKVQKKAAQGGNMVEVSCSAALSELPGGGVKFNTRATTGVGVSETLTRAIIEDLAGDALARCARELAKDIDRYARRKAR